VGDGEAGATEDVDSEVAGTTDSGSDGTLGDGGPEQPDINSAMNVAADAVPVAILNKLTRPPQGLTDPRTLPPSMRHLISLLTHKDTRLLGLAELS